MAIDTQPLLNFRLQTTSARDRRNAPTAAWPIRAARRAARALKRQTPVLIALLAVGLLLGVGYFMLAQAPLATALGSGASFGLAAGGLLALARELGRNAIGLSSFGGKNKYPILGAAPDLSAQTLRDLAPDQRTPLGCLLHQPAAGFATAFRDLEKTLSNKQLVAFVGPAPEEGATTAALAVAVTAAQQGRRVIAVDCDLGRRSLTRAIEADPERGVADAVAAPESWRDFLTQEAESGLDVLPAGRTRNVWRSPFDGPGFETLMDKLREDYDLIVLDCPPTLNADGAIVARSADRCVIVTTWDETPIGALNDALRALGRSGPEHTSVFVNRVPSRYALARS
ncbi:tyrosine-protein kinase EpsD [alpha proteobacterium U9-1i]|nr:tyrosine-protein kinase EpsD [alpha proteobacterium U9-1i]